MIQHRVLVASCLTSLIAFGCTTPRPSKHAIETRVAVDGTATLAGNPELVRVATMNALRKLGYEVDESRELLTTAPRTEKVGRWRWARATNPEATSAAAMGAALSQGIVPAAETEPQGTPSDTEIAVSYAVELIPNGDDALSTTVVVQPRATLDGNDVTDEYLRVVGTDATRRRFDEIFDAIRVELSSAASAPTAAAQ